MFKSQFMRIWTITDRVEYVNKNAILIEQKYPEKKKIQLFPCNKIKETTSIT